MSKCTGKPQHEHRGQRTTWADSPLPPCGSQSSNSLRWASRQLPYLLSRLTVAMNEKPDTHRVMHVSLSQYSGGEDRNVRHSSLFYVVEFEASPCSMSSCFQTNMIFKRFFSFLSCAFVFFLHVCLWECQILELQTVVSCHVSTGNQTLVFWKGNALNPWAILPAPALRS